MWFKRISILTLLSTNAAFAVQHNPKSPQSPTPVVESEKSPTPKTSGAPKITTLGTMTTEVEGDLTIVTARLNKIPDWKEVLLEEHGTFLQIKMPQTQIPASGEFVDGNGPFLKKLATFQLPEDDGALRLFLNVDAAKAKLATTAELLGDRMVITIDHKKLEQLISPPTGKQEATAAEIIAKTSVVKDQQAPSDIIANSSKSEAKAGPNYGGNLNDQLVKLAGFCAILFMGLIAAHFVKTKNRRMKSSKFNSDFVEPATMKVLSSINLGQKQKLTLVQVGNQQLLLGVTGESINLITAVDQKPKQSTFTRQLETANPNAEIRLKSAEEINPPRPQRRVAATTTSPRLDSPVKGGRINVGVGEDGPRDFGGSIPKKEDDITKILRDRLKNLPPG